MIIGSVDQWSVGLSVSRWISGRWSVDLIKPQLEVAYVTIRIPAFCLAFYLASAHFGGELQHFGHMGEQKIKRWPIRTQEITGVKLQDQLYDYKVWQFY